MVELDGDEMTRIIWAWIKEKVMYYFVMKIYEDELMIGILVVCIFLLRDVVAHYAVR